MYYTHTFDTLKPGEDAATCDLISGEKLRGWSAYMNSSILPNVTTKLKTIGKKRGTASSTHEKRDVVFSASSKFKKHKQCLIFYGETYFPNLEDEDHNDIQPLFIHETDNWQMPAEKYISAEKYYENTLFRANKTLLKTFGFKTDSLWALPKLCYLLLHDQVEEALQYIQSNADEENIGLEQLVYGLEKYNEEGLYHFSIADQQPQVNALAIACYFGQERVIHSLLKKEVYVDRLTLRDGYSAIHFLLIGPSSLETKLALLPTLIAAGVPVKFKNKYGKSAIDVCLEQLQNEKLAIALLDSDLGPELVSELLSSNDELDALSVEQSAGPCVLARCIANGWFELLSVIIKNANKKELNDYLMYESGIAGAILSHNNVDNLSIGLTALLDGLASKKMKLESDTRQHWVSCLNKRIVTEKVSDKLVVLVKSLNNFELLFHSRMQMSLSMDLLRIF
ncbi:MAG: hypothetical protein HWD59_03545 [Coxiellaceae bacterium]|nr:MAG: hypothetical protein HWD59_03545 [Coxiellaceae bacterium]